jgi:hypothetical protein
MNHVTVTIAHELARKEIKRQLQAKGVKPARVELRVIREAARVYLSEHPELYDRASEFISKSPELTKLAARAELYRNPLRKRR